jgi:hypothetical protein
LNFSSGKECGLYQTIQNQVWPRPSRAIALAALISDVIQVGNSEWGPVFPLHCFSVSGIAQFHYEPCSGNENTSPQFNCLSPEELDQGPKVLL